MAKFKLGADPEFEIRDESGYGIDACTYFPTGSADEVGCDGACSTGEIRLQAGSAYKLEKELNDYIKRIAQKVPVQYEVYAGSGKRHPLGGHIHFSSSVPRNTLLISLLDKFITRPLNRISNRDRRSNSGYGHMGEVRGAHHGGWEYRSPLSWICHPTIAKGVVFTAQVLVKKHFASQLEQGMTIGQMLEGVGKWERIHIEKFHKFMKEMKDKNLVLEDVRVFKAWAKKRKMVAVSSIKAYFRIEDEGIGEVKSLGIYPVGIIEEDQRNLIDGYTVLIKGAGVERTEGFSNKKAVFLNSRDMIRIGNVNSFQVAGEIIRIMVWGRHSREIGLSMELRRDNPQLGAKVIEKILAKFKEAGIGMEQQIVVEG